MAFVLANGITHHVQELGSGRPVVMLHGLLGSMATWYFTAAPVLARSHRVLLYDLRGHGKSARAPTGYGVASMADDLESLTAGFSTDPLTLIGHSYGAAIALQFALRRPERVDRLVLVESPLPPSDLQDLEAFVGLRWDEKMGALPESVRASLERQGRRGRKFVDNYRFLARDSSLLSDLRSNLDISDETLARMDRRALLLYGTRSSCQSVGKRLSQVLPRAEFLLIEGGHFLPVDAPTEVTAHIMRFLKSG